MTTVSSEQYESLKKKLRKLQALAEQGYRGEAKTPTEQSRGFASSMG